MAKSFGPPQPVGNAQTAGGEVEVVSPGARLNMQPG